MPEPPQPTQPDPKNPITLPEPKPYVAYSEKDIIVLGKYSDEREKLASLSKIAKELSDDQFILQKGVLNIYRYEEVIFGVYPHLGVHRRRGTTAKDVFENFDPMAKLGSGALTLGGSLKPGETTSQTEAT